MARGDRKLFTVGRWADWCRRLGHFTSSPVGVRSAANARETLCYLSREKKSASAAAIVAQRQTRKRPIAAFALRRPGVGSRYRVHRPLLPTTDAGPSTAGRCCHPPPRPHRKP